MRVLDPEGLPLEGAWAEVRSQEFAHPGVSEGSWDECWYATNRDGRITATIAVGAGGAKVTVEKHGYGPVYWRIHPEEVECVLTLRPGDGLEAEDQTPE